MHSWVVSEFIVNENLPVAYVLAKNQQTVEVSNFVVPKSSIEASEGSFFSFKGNFLISDDWDLEFVSLFDRVPHSKLHSWHRRTLLKIFKLDSGISKKFRVDDNLIIFCSPFVLFPFPRHDKLFFEDSEHSMIHSDLVCR